MNLERTQLQGPADLQGCLSIVYETLVRWPRERPWRRYVPSAELAGPGGKLTKKIAVDQAKLESLALLAVGTGC